MNNKQMIIATSQFPVTTNIESNYCYIVRHIHAAKSHKANIIHFPELSLSGYETEITNLVWSDINSRLNDLKMIAKKNNIYVVVGVHKQNKDDRPLNTTVLISSNGTIVGEYIKANLYGKEKDRFSCYKNSFITEIMGIKCGFLICFDSSFPSLFFEYRRQGTEVIFLSYYNAKSTKPKNSMDELMKSQFVTRATDNHLYISGSNSSSSYSRMPSSFVCPDGTLSQMIRHKSGILISAYPSENLGWTL